MKLQCAAPDCDEWFEFEEGRPGRPQIYHHATCARRAANLANAARRKAGIAPSPKRRGKATGKAHWEIHDGQPWYILPDGRRRRGEWRVCQYENCPRLGEPFSYTASQGTGEYCSRSCSNKAFKPHRHRRGEDHPAWKGGRTVNREGYVSIRVNGEYVAEHRHVMEQHLGRSLRPGETVHHKNGVKDDNRLDNLELRGGPHGKGQAAKDLVAYAKEILALYEPGHWDANLKP